MCLTLVRPAQHGHQSGEPRGVGEVATDQMQGQRVPDLEKVGSPLAYAARWWFQIFFMFTPYLGKWSNLTNIFQMGLKPPTRQYYSLPINLHTMAFYTPRYLKKKQGYFAQDLPLQTCEPSPPDVCVCFFFSLRQLDRVAQHRGNVDPGTMGTREFPPQMVVKSKGTSEFHPQKGPETFPEKVQDCKNCLVPWICSLKS